MAKVPFGFSRSGFSGSGAITHLPVIIPVSLIATEKLEGYAAALKTPEFFFESWRSPVLQCFHATPLGKLDLGMKRVLGKFLKPE
ncbi:hypothetical protein F9K80_18490 [Brucella intermedia]|nr:hypothetical protein [Brucella intermedia]KAB2707140.1 hypothetical protein F9K80_18490 [Brucella intermedia]